MIVVIGASSSIGKYLLSELVKQDREFFATSCKRNIPKYCYQKKIAQAKVNIVDRDDFNKLPANNIEAVILLASLLPANRLPDYPITNRFYADINIIGTINVLEYCRQIKAKKIIFTSSHCDVAGLWGCGRPITENDQRNIVYTGDHAMYAITKVASMELIEHYHQEYGLQGIVFRLPAVYAYCSRTGIFNEATFITSGFNIFIRRAMLGMKIELWGNPQKGKDILYVKDVVNALLKAIDNDKVNGLYNIATGIRTSLEDEVQGIIQVFSPIGNRSEVSYRPDKPDTTSYLYDINKAKRDIGYTVQYTYRKMLEDYKYEMNNATCYFSM